MKNNSHKQALIVSPYLDHLGGGERYMLQIASVLQSIGCQVYFAWTDAKQILAIAQQLNIHLEKPKLHPELYHLYFQNHPLKTYLATRGYDLIFYLSDGSLPLLGGKKNIIHFQVPFHQVGGKSFKNKLKLKTIDEIIVNSRFTKKVIDQEYGVDSLVVYPPVHLPNLPKNLKKKQIILSVGRFEPSLNVKRQDILIQAFKKLSPQLPNWKLVLAGGAKEEAQAWVQQLRQMADDFPIEIKTNLSHIDLQKLYQQAAIYWHAAGYQVNEQQNPELVEHFGITTVEAIAHQCLPLVIPKGGQREIVSDPAFHWHSIDELVQKTQNISQITDHRSPITDMSQFSQTAFNKKIKQLIQ